MSSRKKDQTGQLNSSEMRELRKLTGDADGDKFSLEEILSEFRGPSGTNVVRITPKKESKVVAFPKIQGPDDEEEEIPEVLRGRPVTPITPILRADPVSKPDPEPESEEPEDGQEPAEPAEDAADSEGTAETEPEEGPAEKHRILQTLRKTIRELEPEPDDQDTLVQFPQKNRIRAIIQGLSNKGDQYADRMFEAADLPESDDDPMERLIPGTDEEDEPEPKAPEKKLSDYIPSRWKDAVPKFRIPRPKPDPTPPDPAPASLARAYNRGLKGLSMRRFVILGLFLLAVLQLVLPMVGVPWPPPFNNMWVQCWLSELLLVGGVLASSDVLIVGVTRALRGRIGMELITLLSVVFTLTDGLFLAVGKAVPVRLPYSVVVLGALLLQIHGYYLKRYACRQACKSVTAVSSPYRVAAEHGTWNGKDTFVKWSGPPKDFSSQLQADDGAQLMFRRICPILIILCVILAPVCVWGHWKDLLWALSALFTASAAFGASLIYGRSVAKVMQRLLQSGAVVAGWPGIVASRKGTQIVISDTDLFPPGSITLNGYKVMGDFPRERVISYTATVMRDAGSPLTRIFHDQLRTLGGLMRNTTQLTVYEGGGYSAYIRGDRVLVGSASFMNLMEINLPPGLNVRSAVFCAVNGELAGIFALNYSLPDVVLPSLEELMRDRVAPVLATRDFNLIPSMLQHRFRIAADKMEFPPVERRRELSSKDRVHSGTLTALLCREGLYPFAEAVTAARRMYWGTEIGAGLCCLGSILGIALAAYLVSVSAYTSLSPLNLLLFMGMWLLPVLALSEWMHRF